jgi:hypothetical protein
MTKAIPPSRSTKKAAARRAGQPAVPWPLVFVGLGALAVVGVVALATYQTVQQRAARTAPIQNVQTFADPGAGHVTAPVTYDVTPPVGGPHYAEWQNCGIYDQPIPNENAVHSLEHGAVWITYRPDLPADQVVRLRTLVRGRSYALLSPYPDLPAPVVASAWGLQLRVENAGDERLGRFLVKYMQGPQTPEPGAVCYAGVGAPILQ